MTEDIEFYKLLIEHQSIDKETEKVVSEFKNTFYDTKSVLRHFLKDYTHDNAVLDDNFFESF